MESITTLTPVTILIAITISIVVYLIILWIDNKMYYLKYDLDLEERKELAKDNLIIQIAISILCGYLYIMIQ